jgi:serine protease
MKVTTALVALGALALAAPVSAAPNNGMPVIHNLGVFNGADGNGNGNGNGGSGHGHGGGGGGGTANLIYHGGGVETAPKVYLVFWGSQWTNNDPSHEASILTSFLSNVGGSQWNGTVTQYCQGVASGSTSCSGGQAVGNPSGVLVNSWSDGGAAAPSSPSQSQLAAEAVRAAAHFGNTAAGANANVQYVIATATGNSASGFGSSYCAWHSSTSSSYGNVAYTNLPYITDAGQNCGAGFNGLGTTAGITIVEGHEFAES